MVYASFEGVNLKNKMIVVQEQDLTQIAKQDPKLGLESSQILEEESKFGLKGSQDVQVNAFEIVQI